jgi:enoyl-CoA hydratase
MGTAGSSPFGIQRVNDGSIVTVTLLRAQCLDVAGKRDLTAVFGDLSQDARARAVILASGHPQALLVDVGELAHMTAADALSYSRAGQHLMETIEALPVPVIAAVSGPALGGGCELVLSCDLAVCTEDATFGQIEVNGGVVPAFGGTWRLVRRTGYQRACQMIYTGAIVDAPTAKAYGIVLDVVPSDELLTHCHALATQMVGASRAAVAEAKRILTASSGRGPETANSLEQAAFSSLFGTPDQRVRMEAFVAGHSGDRVIRETVVHD